MTSAAAAETSVRGSGPTVTGTYRLQLHAGFGFADAAEQVPYLARLGVSHLYLSPILTAVPGSLHGYDVLDHSRVSPELGGEAGFRSLVDAARSHGLGIVVDVVPNHMAFVAPEWANEPLWQVLREGQQAATADWFDIDWAHGEGRLGLPLLGQTLEATLEAGELTLDRLEEGPHTGEHVIRYHDHVFPLAPGTHPEEGSSQPSQALPGEEVAAVLERQHYRLAGWREADELLGYRRFFEVDQLIAVRVELPEVFEATHRLLLDLHHEGLIDAFRIDHPDGLADPQGYLERLGRALKPGTPIWVEKILEGDERLPDAWPVAGTTGYDALRAVQGALVDPFGSDTVTETWLATGGEPLLSRVIETCKRLVTDELLQPEVGRLHRAASSCLPSVEPGRLREALTELLVGFEVYRAYVRPGAPPAPEALTHLEDAVGRARTARPDLTRELAALCDLAAAPDPSQPAAVDFAVRLQQTCGPVMAKGIEDTAFYRWQRQTARNEVGGDPGRSPEFCVGDLHAWAGRQQERWPLGMTTLSTHDTKRSEDVRARIFAVAGDHVAWQRCSAAAATAAERAGVDKETAHLIWQTLVGAGFLEEQRLHDYLLKAIREAKQHTAWVDGDPAYEQRVLDLASAWLAAGPVHEAVAEALAANTEEIRAVTLAAKLLQLTLPGVPDCYQGCELVDLSLVDPDNRRPVDYADRARRWGRLEQGQAPQDLADEKLLVTTRTLAVRKERPVSFGEHSAYTPLVPGRGAGLAHLRGDDVACVVTRLPHTLRRHGGWAEEVLPLPEGEWQDRLSGRTHRGGAPRWADLLESAPVALLVRT
ncbi:MAG TPA: malto-oligosyltrehalose synthase [Segeticoccus sp.]|uniref:malto-oligosyltrehalose synthase n=1 Tax=Segeticoccus sp. TaxID=2706531 RepID=UPI002D7EF079|nr:malto-oligosyltrehalose synthase [Segeticoccus sp.]HET8601339.1 malto-oligosyltrehalose synthase [Segeticoccus sp.]